MKTMLFSLILLATTSASAQSFMKKEYLPAVTCEFSSGVVFTLTLQDVLGGYRDAIIKSKDASMEEQTGGYRVSEGGRCLSLNCKPGKDLKLANDSDTLEILIPESGPISGSFKDQEFTCK